MRMSRSTFYQSLLSYLLAFLLLLGPPTGVLAANLTERYELCKTPAQINQLQQTYGLIQADATPTRAAFLPGWPESLLSFVISIYSILTAFIEPEFNLTTVIFKGFIPFVLLLSWAILFGVAQSDKVTAGWLSMNWTTAVSSVLSMAELGELGSDSVNGKFGNFLGVIIYSAAMCLAGLQIAGSLAIVAQRWSHTGFGSIAYRIFDAHGCVPYNGFAYLERGARSRAFKIIQTVELAWSLTIIVTEGFVVTIWGGLSDRDEGGKPLKRITFAACTMLITIPVLVYQSIIATKGRPVVISGNCMLVELDPRFGFLDSQISNWWKALSALTGL